MPLKDAEDYIAETDRNFDEEIAEKNSENMLTVEGYYVSVPELGLRLRDGTIFTWRQNSYEPDLSVTVVYGESEKWLYYEQDGYAITLYNYLGGKMSLERIENLECTIVSG